MNRSLLHSLMSHIPSTPDAGTKTTSDHEDDSREDDDRDEAKSSGAQMTSTDGRALPFVSANLEATAEGGIARVVLEQTFENPHDDRLRVTYRMPLPADGAVSGYEFRIGDRVVKGTVEPKAAARERFEQALADGKTAGLLEEQRPDIFTQELGNVPPHTSIVARITVDQKLTWLLEGEWELRFPTVIGPRYIGSSETAQDAKDVAIVVVGPEADPHQTRSRIRISARIADTVVTGRNVESPSHVVKAGKDGTIELASADGARLDRDLVLRWAVAEPEVGVRLSVARPAAGLAHAHLAYGLLTIVPPRREDAVAIPRDLIVLLDTSGSMNGTPLDLAKRVVARVVDSLGASDRLELVEFGTTARPWRKTPVNVGASEKKAALAWLMSREANGGTEMRSAVEQALRPLRSGAQRQVVLVTDGYIGGEQEIVQLLHERLPPSCRLHVVGVGAAVNRTLSMSMARAGRGVEALVGPGEDAERAAKRLLDRTQAPVLTDLVVEGDALVEVAPEHVPDVFAGAPVLAALKLKPEGGEIVVRGTFGEKAWERRVAVARTQPGDGAAGTISLFAREHVADLEMRWTIGREAEMIDRTIERVGVVFQIATRLTSWVAVDDRATVDPKGASRSEVIAQELPYGTSMASFGLGPAMPMSFASIAAPMAMQVMAAGMGAPKAPFPQSLSPMAPPTLDDTRYYPTEEQLAPQKRAMRILGIVLAILVALIGLAVWYVLARSGGR